MTSWLAADLEAGDYILVCFVSDQATGTPYAFMGMIDVFIIWWLLVNAIGLAVLYKRRTAPIFWSLFGVYIAIALIVAGVTRSLSGGA